MTQEQESRSSGARRSRRSTRSREKMSNSSPQKSPSKKSLGRLQPVAKKTKKETGSSTSESRDRQGNRNIQQTSNKKQQKAKKRLSLWKRSTNNKEQSQIIGTDDLRDLLDIITTRINATESMTGKLLQEEQLASIVKDVLHSRQESDCISTLSGSVSKHEDRSIVVDEGGNSVQQLVVVLMTLLLQQRNNPGESAPAHGVPTVVMTNLEDTSLTSQKSGATDQGESKDALSLSEATFATEKLINKSESMEKVGKPETSDGVEYTIEDLQSVLSMIRAVKEADDDESTVWSVASTLETSFVVEKPTTIDSMLDSLISILPQSFGLSPANDSFLDPLEEESDSDHETLGEDTALFDDQGDMPSDEDNDADAETTFTVDDSNTNFMEEDDEDTLLTEDVTYLMENCTATQGAVADTITREEATSPSFFTSLWGSGANCPTQTNVFEEEVGTIEPEEASPAEISIDRDDTDAGDESQSGFFSGIFGSKTQNSAYSDEIQRTSMACESAIEATTEAEISFLGAVFGTSVAAIFTGTQPDNNDAESKASNHTSADQRLPSMMEESFASDMVGEANRKQVDRMTRKPEFDNQNKMGDVGNRDVRPSPYLTGLFDAGEDDSSESQDSIFNGTGDSDEESEEERTVNTFGAADTRHFCDGELLGSEVTVGSSETMDESPDSLMPTIEKDRCNPRVNDEGLLSPLDNSKDGVGNPEVLLSSLCRSSDGARPRSVNSSLVQVENDAFLCRVMLLNDGTKGPVEGTSTLESCVLFDGNESSEVAWDRLEQTLKEGLQTGEGQDACDQKYDSHSLPRPKKSTGLLKQLGNRRTSKREKKQDSKRTEYSVSSMSQHPVEAPGIHADLKILSVPKSVDGSNELNTSNFETLDDSTEGAWDHVEYTVVGAENCGASGPTAGKLNEVSSVVPSQLQQNSIERRHTRSSSDLSFKSSGSLDRSIKSVMSRTHSATSSVACRVSKIVKKPLSKTPQDFAPTTSDTPGPALSPFAVKIVYEHANTSLEKKTKNEITVDCVNTAYKANEASLASPGHTSVQNANRGSDVLATINDVYLSASSDAIESTASSQSIQRSNDLPRIRSSSDMSLKSVGSSDRSIKSAISRTHSVASSVASRISKIVKKPLSKPAAGSATANCTSQEAVAPPSSVKIVYQRPEEATEEQDIANDQPTEESKVCVPANKTVEYCHTLESDQTIAGKLIFTESETPDQAYDELKSKTSKSRGENQENVNRCSVVDSLNLDGMQGTLKEEAMIACVEDNTKDAIIETITESKESPRKCIKDTSILDTAKKDLNDSTEGAWDRFEHPLEDISNLVTSEPGKKKPVDVPSKSNLERFNRWRSRRTRQPNVSKNNDTPDGKMKTKANPRQQVASRAAGYVNPRQKRRQQRKESESEEVSPRKYERPVVQVSVITNLQPNENALSVVTQSTTQPVATQIEAISQVQSAVAHFQTKVQAQSVVKSIEAKSQVHSTESIVAFSQSENQGRTMMESNTCSRNNLQQSVVAPTQSKNQTESAVTSFQSQNNDGIDTPRVKSKVQSAVSQIQAKKRMQILVENSKVVKKKDQHFETSSAVAQNEVNKLHSVGNAQELQEEQQDSPWNENWYTNYMKGGHESKAIASEIGHMQVKDNLLVQATAQGFTTVAVSNSVSSGVGPVVSTENSEVKASASSAKEESRDEWESFLHSPFNEDDGNDEGIVAPSIDSLKKITSRISQREELHQRTIRSEPNNREDAHVQVTTVKPKSILKKSNSGAVYGGTSKGFESWRSRKVLEAEKSITSTSKTQSTEGASLRHQRSSRSSHVQAGGGNMSPHDKVAVVNVKQRAREAAQRTATRSTFKRDEFPVVRDPTPQRSNVSAAEKWKGLNPVEHAGNRTPKAKHSNSVQRSSPSAVNEAISAFEGGQFSNQFGDDSGFDGDMSFPPF